MNAIVSVRYDEIVQIKAEFEERQQIAQQLLERLDSRLEALRSGRWVGKSAERFYKQMDDDVLPACQRLSHGLDRGAVTLQQIMELFQAAEEEAALIFRGGDPGGLMGGLRGQFAASYSYSDRYLAGVGDGDMLGAPPGQATVFYVNGIQNDPGDIVDDINAIQRITGQRVTGIYNATGGKAAWGEVVNEAADIGRSVSNPFGLLNPFAVAEATSSALSIGRNVGGFVGDVWQAMNDINEASGYGRIDGGNPAVDQLVNQIVSHDGNVTLIGHSQGGAIVAAALQRLERAGYPHLDRVNVMTLGGAGVSFPDGPTYHHIVNPADPVPFISRVYHSRTGGIPQLFDLFKTGTHTSGSPEGSGHGMSGYYDDIARIYGQQ